MMLANANCMFRVVLGFHNPNHAASLLCALLPLKTVVQRGGDNVLCPIRGVDRFACDLDMSGISRVVLFGNCREWAYLVKGVPVECASG